MKRYKWPILLGLGAYGAFIFWFNSNPANWPNGLPGNLRFPPFS